MHLPRFAKSIATQNYLLTQSEKGINCIQFTLKVMMQINEKVSINLAMKTVRKLNLNL